MALGNTNKMNHTKHQTHMLQAAQSDGDWASNFSSRDLASGTGDEADGCSNDGTEDFNFKRDGERSGEALLKFQTERRKKEIVSSGMHKQNKTKDHRKKNIREFCHAGLKRADGGAEACAGLVKRHPDEFIVESLKNNEKFKTIAESETWRCTQIEIESAVVVLQGGDLGAEWRLGRTKHFVETHVFRNVGFLARGNGVSDHCAAESLVGQRRSQSKRRSAASEKGVLRWTR